MKKINNFVLTSDTGLKTILDHRTVSLTAQTDKSALPTLNKKLKNSRKKQLILEKKHVSEGPKLQSPLLQISDLNIKVTKKQTSVLLDK